MASYIDQVFLRDGIVGWATQYSFVSTHASASLLDIFRGLVEESFLGFDKHMSGTGVLCRETLKIWGDRWLDAGGPTGLRHGWHPSVKRSAASTQGSTGKSTVGIGRFVAAVAQIPSAVKFGPSNFPIVILLEMATPDRRQFPLRRSLICQPRIQVQLGSSRKIRSARAKRSTHSI